MAIGRRYYYAVSFLLCAWYAASHHETYLDNLEENGWDPRKIFGNKYKKKKQRKQRKEQEEQRKREEASEREAADVRRAATAAREARKAREAAEAHAVRVKQYTAVEGKAKVRNPRGEQRRGGGQAQRSRRAWRYGGSRGTGWVEEAPIRPIQRWR